MSLPQGVSFLPTGVREDGSVPFPYDWGALTPKKNPISVTASCFLPTALLSLRLTAWLARAAWFDGLEALPFRGQVLGGAAGKIAVPILSAHGHFNPIPARQKLREFGVRAVVQDWILFPPNYQCERFLAQLCTLGVRVNTYFPDDLRWKPGIYTSFQIFPGVPFSETLALLEETGAKVTYDLAHVRQIDREGQRTLPDWQESWEVLHGRVDNVHFQPLDLTELGGVRDGDESIEIAEMLRVIGASNYKGPITLEIDPLAMAKIIGAKALLPQVQSRYLDKLCIFVKKQLARGQPKHKGDKDA